MSTITITDDTEIFDMAFGEDVSELSSRSENGVDVALLWRQRDNAAVVAVVDHRTGDAFLVDVRDDDNALDMFHHPYAYAARRRPDRAAAAPARHVSFDGMNR
jgi:hypothetical protein